MKTHGIAADGPFYRFDTETRYVTVNGNHVFGRKTDSVDPRDAYDWSARAHAAVQGERVRNGLSRLRREIRHLTGYRASMPLSEATPRGGPTSVSGSGF